MAAALSVLMIVNFLYYKIDNEVLRFLGSMIYTIYITHFASIYLFMIILDKMGLPFHNEITQPYIWPVGVVFALLAAIPFYYIAELPTRNILKRMRGEKTVPSEVTAQTVKL
jgi:peptidoglycan/LPS O-acetylase OafA/YrhL